MKLSKKAKIAILKGKVAKLKHKLKQAREELALQDDQLDKLKTLNESLPTTVRKEKTKGIICYSNKKFGKVYYTSTSPEGNVKSFSSSKEGAVVFESLEEFFSKNNNILNKEQYSFEPIESKGGENVNVQINEQTR